MLRVFSRYFAVQLVAYVVDFGSFLLLSYSFGVNAMYANVAGKIAAGAFAFVAHRRVTFGADGHGNARSQLLRYMLVLGINVPVSSAVLALLLRLTVYPAPAKLLADAICIGATFLLSKHLVFTGPGRVRNGDA